MIPTIKHKAKGEASRAQKSNQRAQYASLTGRRTVLKAKADLGRATYTLTSQQSCKWWIGVVVLTRRLEAYDGVARPSLRRAGHRVTPLRSAAGPGTAPALSSRLVRGHTPPSGHPA